ncbi:cytosine deaminase [Rubrimonas cliftonensis]|uniref:Cytosine deaminase n=1 Tax=Rubrimonas cliftonensis TaxID=89524 RepID=A0A1H3XLN4_9RHOB|nr:cytosine deaminase [Rubrimonas cliftonensis]SEA00259.1 cytosine deaminase [Rubrimonas cliftonensis]
MNRWTRPEGDCRLAHARLLGQGLRDIWLTGDRIAFEGPPDAPVVDLRGCIVMPGFVDCHTHLDKGHIWPRTPNPDGSFQGALESVAADREARWSARDVAARMEFGLRCAYAHGTVALRTHLDSIGPQTGISWPVFAEARDRWAGRIALQAVCLVPIDMVGSDAFRETADVAARHGGVLGAVTFPVPDITSRLDLLLRMAAERGMDVDLHVDETQDPDAATLREVALAVLRTGFAGRVLCGHCCSLARQPDDAASATMDLVAAAALSVVSLPLCNLYLQDRHAARTPRSRGVTLVHELKARGVPVAFASDNTRDPFYAYGDHDMLEVMREAVRVAHLDHPVSDWPAAFAATPARIMGVKAGEIAQGAPADLVVFPAREWTELLSRPHSDRLVIRGGRAIDARPPDYAELDQLFAPEPAQA